jgi:glycolate oxidase FAD binding subunit
MNAYCAQLQRQVASQYRAGQPLIVCGQGSKAFLSKPRQGERVELAPLSGIIQYEPSELVVSAWAGTPLTQLLEVLTEQQQGLLFEPPLFAGKGTVGGMVASGLAGPARAYKGGVRDYVLGMQILHHDGEILKLGGAVMKNVAGFDVTRLLVGSMGVCGPILAVTLKVMPLPKQVVTIKRALTQAESLRWFGELGQQSLPVTATSWWDGWAYVRLAGAEAAVGAALQRLSGVSELVPDATAHAHWLSLRDQTHAIFAAANLRRLSLPLNTPPLASAPSLIEWGGALRWLDATTPVRDLHAQLTPLGGSVTGWPCELVRETQALEPTLARLNAAVRAVYDPKGLFNVPVEAAWKHA